ncbi:MAG: MFS transporter [Sulfolobales archaeon]
MSDILNMAQEMLDRSSWRSGHWKLFIIISATFFLDGVLFSIVPASLYLIAPDIAIYVLAINSLAFMIGAIALGRLADLFGRRILLITSLAIYFIGTVLFLLLHRIYEALIISTSLINLGVGGEVGAAYSALAEMIPARDRGKAIMLSANFWNIGAFIIAGLALIYTGLYQDVETQIRSLALSALVLISLVALARIHIPESPRWLIERGRSEKAFEIIHRLTGLKPSQQVSNTSIERGSREIGLRDIIRSGEYLFRLAILIILTFTQLLTYNMIAYYAPYAQDFRYGIESTPMIILISNLGASVGAFILIPLIDRSRRHATLYSYLGGLATALALTILYMLEKELSIYLAALLINMIFAEWAWASLSALESELFPTGVRASVVGLNTGIAWLANTIVVLAEASITALQFLYIATLLWMIGFIASLLWMIRGVESARIPLEKLVSKPVKK